MRPGNWWPCLLQPCEPPRANKSEILNLKSEISMMSARIRTLVCLLALAATAAPAPAQPKTTLALPKDGRLANLVPVPVPESAAIALSEPLGLLAFCHERSREGPAEVSLVRLDAKGNPAAYST